MKIPDMKTVYRGYSEAKAKAVYDEKKKHWKVQGQDEWTPAEDKLLLELIEQWPDGTRGRWVKISEALNRSTADVNSRWFHVHSPNTDNDYRDILKDAERDLIIKEGRWQKMESERFQTV